MDRMLEIERQIGELVVIEADSVVQENAVREYFATRSGNEKIHAALYGLKHVEGNVKNSSTKCLDNAFLFHIERRYQFARATTNRT